MMKALHLETMPIDDLWQLYEQVGRALAEQLTSEKRKLEQRLSQLRGDVAHSSERQRRPYPKVPSEIPESRRSLEDLGGPRKNTPLD
jgi:DNA-binding protein H-NS